MRGYNSDLTSGKLDWSMLKLDMSKLHDVADNYSNPDAPKCEFKPNECLVLKLKDAPCEVERLEASSG